MGQTEGAGGARPDPNGRGGRPRKAACAPSAQPKREGGLPQSQREKDGERESAKKRAHLAHVMHGQGDPRSHTTSTQRGPPKQCVTQAHGMQGGGEGNGAGPQPEGEEGPPPEQPCMPFVRGLNKEIEGHPQNLLRTLSP